ncbi:hypothetical protein P3T76_004242 [Phytophthora citrophthora]|uniref:Uncharacterized protein n=1 Tax=Phytophthora citrophthora TaxID=4793 RepID=A0AAD9LP40_9STRA|nr:hypothetical protein P3T76_004242 [Phytophthora citrophthora]
MAEEGDEGAVLAFLLGSTPSLDTETRTEAVEEEPETEASAVTETITMCQSETGTLQSGNVEEDDPEESTGKAKDGKDLDKMESRGSDGTKLAELHQLDKKRSLGKDIKKQKLSILPVATPSKISKVCRKSTGGITAKMNPARMRKNLSAEKVEGVPTPEEILFVGCVVIVLIAYLVACVYSFFHPVVLPLPDYKELYSAYDISNVSVHIVNPVDNSLITPQGVVFEWELANFPTEALNLYGAEVFRYQVSLDGEVITSELEFLVTQVEDGDALNRTIRFPIPLRKFTHKNGSYEADLFKLHLEVTIPVPGLFDELKTYEQDVYVRKPITRSTKEGVQLTLTLPVDGTIFEHRQPIVLEYTAVNVHTLDVLLGDGIFTRKTFVNDGNMLLRGLGVGPHKFEIRAVGEYGEIVATCTTHVEIVEADTA